MTSMQASKKRLLPKVLSIFFGSSLVSLAMTMLSGPANAQTYCPSDHHPWGCYRCGISGGSGALYCADSAGNVGSKECCEYHSNGQVVGCTTMGGWCS
jgi:hypothetical protein